MTDKIKKLILGKIQNINIEKIQNINSDNKNSSIHTISTIHIIDSELEFEKEKKKFEEKIKTLSVTEKDKILEKLKILKTSQESLKEFILSYKHKQTNKLSQENINNLNIANMLSDTRSTDTVIKLIISSSNKKSISTIANSKVGGSMFTYSLNFAKKILYSILFFVELVVRLAIIACIYWCLTWTFIFLLCCMCAVAFSGSGAALFNPSGAFFNPSGLFFGTDSGLDFGLLEKFIFSFPFFKKQKGGSLNFNRILNNKIKLEEIYDHIKKTVNISEISYDEAIKYYEFNNTNTNGNKDQYICDFYQFIINKLNNKFEINGIRSKKILDRLILLVNTYNNELIAKECYEMINSKLQEIIMKKNKTKEDIDIISEHGNLLKSKKDLIKYFQSQLEDMDKNIFKLKTLTAYKNNIVDYEIDSYFKNKKISKITKNNIPLVRIKYNEIEELYQQIKTNIEDLYKQVKIEYNKPPYERKTLPHQNMFPITNKNNNKYKYKKIYDIHKLKFTCRESNTEGFIGKLCYIKKLIKDFLNINLHEEKKEELLKIMPLIPKIKKIEHNINKQAKIKNGITSIINKKGFVNNLSNTTED